MAYWSELIWISIISPNASFVGHLAGFLPFKMMITVYTVYYGKWFLAEIESKVSQLRESRVLFSKSNNFYSIV